MSKHLFNIFDNATDRSQAVNIQKSQQNRLTAFQPIKANEPPASVMRMKSGNVGLSMRKPLADRQPLKQVATHSRNDINVPPKIYKDEANYNNKIIDDYEDIWAKTNRLNPVDIANILNFKLYPPTPPPITLKEPLPVKISNWENKNTFNLFESEFFNDIPVNLPDTDFIDYE